MPEYAWMTDVHLNFIDELELASVIKRINSSAAAGLLIGGDIAEALSVEKYLRELANGVDCPIYFVLGNHDYYQSAIADVRAAIKRLCAQVDTLHWLADAGVVALTEQTALVGHGGWGDARFGDFLGSTVRLNDYIMIRELSGIPNSERQERLRALGDEAAEHVRAVLPAALASHRHVVFLSHVPPFREAAIYSGKICNDDWLPHFSCKALGDALRDIMSAHPACAMTALCGHTHGSGSTQILPNLHVRTGGATYGAPRLQQPLLSVA